MSKICMSNFDFVKKCNMREDIDDYDIMSKYIKGDCKIKFKHKLCNHEFYMIPGNFYLKKQKCPNCFKGSKINSYSEEYIRLEIRRLTEDEYVLVGKYINSGTKIKILHRKCNNMINITWNDFKSGYRCAHCNGNAKISYNELSKKLK